MSIPVTILSGYLGAGKTSLINHALSFPAAARVAVLVNDFGAINIDASLIAQREVDRVALSNGCVCCTINDDLSSALDAQLRRPSPPEHILIEASGVAEPARMLRYVTSWPGLRLEAVVTVADAEAIRRQAGDKFVGRLVQRQLAAADLVVLNKIDLIREDDEPELCSWLARIAPQARVALTRRGNIHPAMLFGDIRAKARGNNHAAAHDELADIVALSVAFPRAIETPRIEHLCAGLPGSVHRIKGFVRDAATGCLMLVQYSGSRRCTVERFDPMAASHAPLALVAIGTNRADLEGLRRRLVDIADGAIAARSVEIQKEKPDD